MRLPKATENYDTTNEQQTRRALESAIDDIDSKLSSLLTSSGTLAANIQNLTVANGVNNNVALGYGTYTRLSGPTASFTLTGLTGGESGRVLLLRNTTAYDMTLSNDSGLSTAKNRILTQTGGNVTLSGTGGCSALLFYDGTSERWVQVAGGGNISANTTLNVPGTYASIAAAMSSLVGQRINNDVTVTIQVANGNLNMASGVTFTHPDGSRIQILGNTTTPSSCTLTATAGNAIFYVDDGVVSPFIDGFRLIQSGTKANIGVLADNGGTMRIGSNMEVSNFYYGLAARYGSHIEVSGGSGSSQLLVEDAGDVGIWAFVGSSINCPYAIVDGSIDAVENLGFGIMAEYGSAINCQYAEAMNNHRAGIASFSGSAVRAYDTNTHDNTTHGYESKYGSSLTAHSGTSTDNAAYGSSWDFNSNISANPAITYSGNTSGEVDNGYVLDGAGPAIRFNTNGPYLKNTATNVLSMQDSTGSSKLYFDLVNTRIGIGVSSPSYAIDASVAGGNCTLAAKTTTSGNAQLDLNSAGSSDYSIALFRQASTEYGRIQLTALGNMTIQATTQIDLRTASTSRLFIDSSGILDYKQAAVTAGAPFTNTGKVSVKINGVSYNIMLCA